MTKRRPAGQKKTGKSRRRWLRQLGAAAAAVVALTVVALALFGMTRGGASGDSAHQHSEVTPVVEEKGTETAPRQGGPAMAFDTTSVDFGDVPLDTPVNYAFEFSNQGDATLQIEDVQVKTLEGC